MKRYIVVFISTVWVAMLFMPRVAMAFGCSIPTAKQTFTMAATSMPKKSSDTPLISSSFTTFCWGHATTDELDALRIQSITMDPAFTDADYTVEVSLGGGAWQTPSAVQYACIWPGGNKNYNCSPIAGTNRDNTRSISIRVSRNSNSAIMTPIPNNTTIATILIYQRSRGIWDNLITLTYKLSGEISAIVPTCDVKNFDNNVTLPDVRRADLVNHGAGRYTGVTKEFNINLACENTPKVSVKFNGDKMPGITSEDVLVNKLSGNDNIGIQLAHNNNAMKIGENIELLSAAADSENLKFNAYYYYKGGAVQSGPIKSQTEFTFIYE
ncbi:fimbrial protein [Phytobacter diazotrophicus]|uniref:fimbrial protein n=1 Tax=Phytobacter diazotrophicus TaxID=395631 RepID=UPI00145256D5|nr:fimbrial protein [Phytobacter diazotrophicus]QJF15658.1 type 1 fimbrial protein [Phytobacter diazotrophicus]